MPINRTLLGMGWSRHMCPAKGCKGKFYVNRRKYHAKKSIFCPYCLSSIALAGNFVKTHQAVGKRIKRREEKFVSDSS